MSAPEIITGHTTHARRGRIAHAFRYRITYVLIDPDETRGPALFARRRWNLFTVRDRDYGPASTTIRGAEWARDVLARIDTPETALQGLRLLTQPQVLGLGFNPVSFWLAADAEGLRAVIAEVNNTFGDRHFYLCHHSGFRPIRPDDQLMARKLMHVSPFQQVAGHYGFSFDISTDRIGIRILHENGAEGVLATLSGSRKPLTNRTIVSALAKQPFVPVRTIALIYWQALRLRLKGAPYRTRPVPPVKEVSECTTSQNV